MRAHPMRPPAKALFAALLLVFGTVAAEAAPITYNVNRAIGAGGVTGVVTTDGTIGTLATGNILSWSLALAGNGASASISSTDANAFFLVRGSSLRATASQLLFDFGGPAGDLFVLQRDPFSGRTYWCEATSSGDCFQGSTVTPQFIFDGTAITVARTGEQVIAAVPTPAALALLGTALLGLGALRRLATATGA